MAQTLLIVMALLVCGFVSTRLAAWLRLPHSVFLVVMGVAAGLVTRAHDATFSQAFASVFPPLVLHFLLPLLVFEAAYSLDLRQLRRDLVPIIALACVALTTSTVLIGAAFHWLLDQPLLPALTFGALISATDPVAVVALFKEMGTSKRLTHLIEAESLVNDGTAIVLFRVLLGLSMSVAIGPGVESVWGVAAFEIVRVTVVGIGVGLAVAGVCQLLLRVTATSGAAQIGLTFAGAYLSYLIADDVCHASGVLATMATGIVLGRVARLEFNAAAAAAIHQLWGFLALSANIIVFFAVGLSANPRLLFVSFSSLLLTVGIVYLARALSVFTTVPLANSLRIAEPVPTSYQIVLVWGGLRGGLALALVLLLPPTFPGREFYLTVATAVVLTTLIVNAMSTKAVLRLLKLDRMTEEEAALCKKILRFVRDQADAPLRPGGAESLPVPETRLRQDAATDAQRQVPATEHAGAHRFELSLFLLAEQQIYDARLATGLLARPAYAALRRSVDERTAALAQGYQTLADYRFTSVAAQRGDKRWYPLLQLIRPNYILSWLILRLEVLLNLHDALQLAMPPQAAKVPAVARIWLAGADAQLELFYRIYSHYAGAVQAFLAANRLRARAESHLEALLAAGLVSHAIVAEVRAELNATHRRAVDEAWELLRPSAAYLLARVYPFRLLPRVGLRKVVDMARRRMLVTGDTLCTTGDAPGLFFLVVAGMLEAQPGGRRLLSGEAFGETALLLGQAQALTVVAATTAEVLEIDQNMFAHILAEYPLLLQESIARALAEQHAYSDGSDRV